MKKGVQAKHHAVIYTGDKAPSLIKGEKDKGLDKKPIRMKPDGSRHKLHFASRLNYAKLYTVEYNVKVWFIGRIEERSAVQLETDYNRIHSARKDATPPVSEDTFSHASGGEPSNSGGNTAYNEYSQAQASGSGEQDNIDEEYANEARDTFG